MKAPERFSLQPCAPVDIGESIDVFAGRARTGVEKNPGTASMRACATAVVPFGSRA